MTTFSGYLLLGILATAAGIGLHQKIDRITRQEVLSEGQYRLEWTADLDNDFINFTMTVKTTGYIGLGFSYTGGMAGADIFIAGVSSDGVPYAQDQHAKGQMAPIMDKQQDWTLYESAENATHTIIKAGRKLTTCDEDDIPLNDDTIKVIWSFGETDEIAYHKSSRGARAVNVLDPHPKGADLSKYKVWAAGEDYNLPAEDTTYWCTFFKAPELTTKHHIVGFDVHVKDSISLHHAHHVDVMKCTAPEGNDTDEYFGPYLGYGYDCYHSDVYFPIDDCVLFEFQWSIGGELTMFPDDIGVPFGGTGKPAYYMIEVHHNNPEKIEGLVVKTGMEFYYTEELRPIEAGFLFLGSFTSKKYSLTLPPDSSDFIQAHHCVPGCTSHFPSDGITAFVYLLHSHFSGSGMRIRHFRDGTELPWFANDEHYDFNYQNNRMLREEIKIMPGDQLTLECNYDTTWKVNNPNNITDLYTLTTIAGRFVEFELHAKCTLNFIENMPHVRMTRSPREEMCQTFIMYYPRTEEINACGSYFPQEKMLEYFGIQNLSDVYGEMDPIVYEPEVFAGKKYTKVIEEDINWTKEKREDFQKFVRFGDHQGYCADLLGDDDVGFVNYPDIKKEYVPLNKCTLDFNSGSASVFGMTFGVFPILLGAILCTLN